MRGGGRGGLSRGMRRWEQHRQLRRGGRFSVNSGGWQNAGGGVAHWFTSWMWASGREERSDGLIGKMGPKREPPGRGVLRFNVFACKRVCL